MAATSYEDLPTLGDRSFGTTDLNKCSLGPAEGDQIHCRRQQKNYLETDG